MDLVPLVNGLGADAATATQSVGTTLASMRDVLSANWVSWLVLSLFLVAAYAFWRRISSRVGNTIEDAVFSNWRLALLGATGIVLSLASGWTTWDGMKNFTNEPVLSFMITFGIQGVMLIVAWLIGESFATGMNTNSHAAVKGGLAGAVIFLLLLGLILGFSGVVSFDRYLAFDIGWGDTAILAIGIIIVAVVLFASGAEMFEPYMASTRVIVRNAVLWIMFLSCMATSVFFSFDSLFSAIFPAQERERAAQLRAQNQVAGIIADIGQTISTQRLREADALFTSEGWITYEGQLDTLAARAQGSQDVIEKYFQDQIEDRNRAVAEQKQRKTSAVSQQAGLTGRAAQLNAELGRLKAQRPEASAAMVEQQQVVRQIERELDEQRAVVLAEEKGVEGSGKAGRGPLWRAAVAEQAKIKARLQVANERLRAPQDRLVKLDKRIASITAELAQIEGELSILQGEAQTAEQRIAAAQRTGATEETAELIDPTRILPAFERAKVDFRQEPTRERLAALQQQCSQLLSGMLAAQATKDRVRDIDCDPKRAAEAASVLFTLNDGLQGFAQRCASGEQIERNKSTDALFEFARTCLSDSGLPSEQTDKLRTEINLAELNRDDRAHRFVVTWNAFQDGNRLAYLALAIAIAIDALVFMSGLFGANAVRSPLQDVPSLKPRTAKQLEQIVENALLPNKYASAHATLEAMQPLTPVDGFTQEVLTSRVEPSRRGAVVKVLNAGSAIGAVQRDPERPDERHYIRPELFEYLSIVAKREFEANAEHVHLAELEQTITVALQPYVGDHAHIVLGNLTPITKREGDFSSVLMMDNVSLQDRHIVNNVLNAGTLLGVVQHSSDKKNFRDDDYLIHGQLHKTLLRIAAANPMQGKRLQNPHAAIASSSASPAAIVAASNGDLTPDQSRVEQSDRSLLADHTGRYQKDLGGRDDDRIKSLQDYYVSQLVGALGIDSDLYLNLSGEPFQAAMAASTAFEQVRAKQPALNNRLMTRENEALNGLDRAFKRIEDYLEPDDSEERAYLNRAFEEVRDNFGILMLLPGAPNDRMLAEIVAELEGGAGQGLLSPSEQGLYDASRRLEKVLNSGDRASKLSWQRIDSSLRQVADDLAA